MAMPSRPKADILVALPWLRPASAGLYRTALDHVEKYKTSGQRAETWRSWVSEGFVQMLAEGTAAHGRVMRMMRMGSHGHALLAEMRRQAVMLSNAKPRSRRSRPLKPGFGEVFSDIWHLVLQAEVKHSSTSARRWALLWVPPPLAGSEPASCFGGQRGVQRCDHAASDRNS